MTTTAPTNWHRSPPANSGLRSELALLQIEIGRAFYHSARIVHRLQLENVLSGRQILHGHSLAERDHRIVGLLGNVDSHQTCIEFLRSALAIKHAKLNCDCRLLARVVLRQKGLVDLHIE